MKILWYLYQPLLCYLGFHDWYRGERSGSRECEYCERKEVFDHADSNGRIHWRKI